MSDTVGDAYNKYISIGKAVRLLDVSFERITWFIATGQLAWKRDPRDGNRKLVALQDVQQLRNSPHLLAPWIIYALVDPRDNAVRYVGRAYEPQIRLKAHLKDEYAANPAKYRWIRELRKNRLLPHMEVLEGVYGTMRDADTRERAWIRYFINAGAALRNILYIDQAKNG